MQLELATLSSATKQQEERGSMSYQASGGARAEEAGSLLSRGSVSETNASASPPLFRRNLKVWGSVIVLGAVAFASGFLWRGNGADEVESQSKEGHTITVQLEGKHHHGTKSHHVSSAPPETHFKCDDGMYSKRTLKLAYELPFASLFKDTKGQRKYEASSVVVVGDDAYAVCDSSWAISKFSSELQPFQDTNVQIGDPAREEEDSGYEALIHNDGTFYVVRESVQHEDSSYHAIIEELELGDEDYDIKNQCSAEFEFEGSSKGFEGAIALHDLNNEMVILGLCEGNHCSETHKSDRGNGQIVVMRKGNQDSSLLGCQWNTIKILDIPSSAYFKDYSALTATKSGKIGISSQEDSQFWVGQLLGQNDAGLWDVDAMAFDPDKGKLYDFPKNDSCETIYCNIEGVHWLNDELIIASSDAMKSKGRQDYRCFAKDQSVHVFALPP